MTPAFSAVIPLHNKQRTIERTLRSIVAQTEPVAEIIVVDDNSSDGSGDVVRELDFPQVRLLRRDTPGPGGYAARNLGSEEARSDWLTFLDADDEWRQDHLSAAREVIEAEPEVNTIFFGRSVENREQHFDVRVPEARVYGADELISLFATKNFFHVNSLVIRKDAFLRTGGFREDRGWKRGGDSELWLRLITDAGPIFMSDKITTVYDMNFSDVIRNKKAFTAEHPIYRTVQEMLAAKPGRARARALKRLSNRKTLEWMFAVPNSMMGIKLAMMSHLLPGGMTGPEWRLLAKSFLRRR